MNIKNITKYNTTMYVQTYIIIYLFIIHNNKIAECTIFASPAPDETSGSRRMSRL